MSFDNDEIFHEKKKSTINYSKEGSLDLKDLKMKLHELVMIGIQSPTLEDFSHFCKKHFIPGCVILTLSFFQKLSPQQKSKEFIFQICSKIKKISPSILISIDHEGGYIQNLQPPSFSFIPAQGSIGLEKDTSKIEKVGTIIGRELGSIGIDWNFAPVADVSIHKNYPFRYMGRSYSDDPTIVSNRVISICKGMNSFAVIPCCKHFPGMGNVSKDNHYSKCEILSTKNEFEKIDLFPFVNAFKSGHCRTVMTNHAFYKHIDDTTCATLSKRIISDILRGELKFNGVCITDDLGMAGVLKCVENKCHVAYRSLIAGCDVVMFSYFIERAVENFNYILDELKKLESKEKLELKKRKELMFLSKRINESYERVMKLKRWHVDRRKEIKYDLQKVGSEEDKKFLRSFPSFFKVNKKKKVSVGTNSKKKGCLIS